MLLTELFNIVAIWLASLSVQKEQNASFLGGWLWAGTVHDVQDKKTEVPSTELVWFNQMR